MASGRLSKAVLKGLSVCFRYCSLVFVLVHADENGWMKEWNRSRGRFLLRYISSSSSPLARKETTCTYLKDQGRRLDVDGRCNW